MTYSDFTTDDFINDAQFRLWVQQPDEVSDTFWTNFLKENPDKNVSVTNARTILKAIENQVQEEFLPKEDEDQVFSQIQEQISLGKGQNVRRLPVWWAWAAAASVVLGIMIWQFIPKNDVQINQVVYESNREKALSPLTEKINKTNRTILVTLDDGSSIFLNPNSKISYATNFNQGNIREVYLSGEAFFEVAKNPNKPFLVYANEMITKVLGTSFNIRAFPNEKDVIVKVRTGKVSVAVARVSDVQQKISSRELGGIMLLPNQQAVLARQEVRLTKSVVENPTVVNKNQPQSFMQQQFVFSAESATEVFKSIENGYGVDIVFDETLLSQCQFTGNLTDESLYEKLDIICKTIEAQYQISDTQIIITSKGCQ
jgi:transmembrane sensor